MKLRSIQRIGRVALWITLAVMPMGAYSRQASDTQGYPTPGKRVDLGGYRLHSHAAGKGNPAVVLVAGAGDFSLDSSLVQPEVARFARVCSYDRAGFGWSDLGPTPRTMQQEAAELHLLLKKAGIKAPYVLVG